MRADGRPLTGVVDRVIVESIAFEMARTPLPSWGLAGAVVPVARILKTARTILVDREGYDPEASKAAVLGRLGRRPEHGHVHSIPSLHPEAGIPVAERIRRRQATLEEFLQ